MSGSAGTEHAKRRSAVSSARPGEEAPSQHPRVRGSIVATKFVLKKGSTGKFHFNLVATNGQVIATSESYESKAAALNGIESVKKNAPVAQVDDQTTT
jgi:uncharacterized protein YegP (UPF0339 family)